MTPLCRENEGDRGPNVWWQRVGPTLLDLAGVQTSAGDGGFVGRNGRNKTSKVGETQRERRKKARGDLQLCIYIYMYICLDNTSSLKFPY